MNKTINMILADIQANNTLNVWAELFRNTPKTVIDWLNDRFIEITLEKTQSLFSNRCDIFIIYIDGDIDRLLEMNEIMEATQENAKIIIESLHENGVMFAIEK